MASCSDEPSSSSLPNDGWYDIVTLSSVDSSGSAFQLQKDGDSDVITYTSTYTFSKDTVLSIGDRLIIMYLRADDAAAYTSGAIILYGYRYLDNSPQKVVTDSSFNPELWASERIDPLTLTRTGNYINMQARLSCLVDLGAEQWYMVADPATLADDYPRLYIVYQAVSPGDNYAKGYASWDIGSIWRAETCCGVHISYLSPSGVVTRTISK